MAWICDGHGYIDDARRRDETRNTMIRGAQLLIMITVLKNEFLDVFRNKEWPLFNEEMAQKTLGRVPNFSLVEFNVFRPELPRDMAELDQACAERIAPLLYKNDKLPKESKVWLFIAQQRTGGIKSLLKKEWLDVLPLATEVFVESNRGAKSAGLVEIAAENFLTAIRILRANDSACIIASGRSDIVSERNIVHTYYSAFPSEKVPQSSGVSWAGLSLLLCPLGDILLRVSGSYDERLAAIDCIMTPEKAILFKEIS